MKNTLYAFVFRGGTLAVSFLSTPVFISYFHDMEVLGLWFTLWATLNWFLAFDLGVGNGLRNRLVTALASGDRGEVRRVISSGMLSTLGVTLLTAAVGTALIWCIDLNRLLNIDPGVVSGAVLTRSTYLLFGSVMLRFMLTTVTSIFYALQRAAVNTFVGLCVYVLQLGYIFLFDYSDPAVALEQLARANLLIATVPSVVAGIVVFMTELKDCRPRLSFCTRRHVESIMGVGLVFFCCELFYLVLSNANEFFISHFWDNTDTADYSFYYRVAILVSMMVSLGLSPTWSMVTKAHAEGNVLWLRKVFSRLTRVGVGVVVLQFMLIPFLQPVFDLWLGKGVLTVTLPTAVCFACFGSVFVYSSILSTIVNGLSRLRLQFVWYGVGALLKIAFIIVVSRLSDNWTWVVWANVIILAPYCIVQHWQLKRFLLDGR